ncbi:MAG: acyloxyacyl hydrolase [Prevotella sp.]|nr:acyloxyacyl hydrolase [Prevotella sp.]
MKRKRFLIVCGLLFVWFSTFAEETDSLRTCSEAPSSHHFGYTLKVSPGKLIVMDEWQRRYQKHTRSTAFAIEANYTSLPKDKDDFAIDYNYPTLDFGLKFSLNDVTMHRSTDEAWGMAKEVDYDSELGNIVTAYATFTRPIYRNNRWMFDYMLGTGIGYGKHKYSRGNNIDNELTGSRFLIYFTGGLHATYRFADDWGMMAGVEFYHHSNGALNRPNKGANIVGPVVGLRYMPYDK